MAKKKKKVYLWETLVHARWWAEGGHHDMALSLLLDGVKGRGVITGGRPKWAPPQRSAASLRLILGGKYLSVADIEAKIRKGDFDW